jgi:hypothetical protein
VRHRREHDKLRRRKWVDKNKVRDRYNNLKGNAKRRRIFFTLTLQQFERFCAETDYIARCGRCYDNLTIDRRDATKGYEDGNLQVLTLSANSTKFWTHDRFGVPMEPLEPIVTPTELMPDTTKPIFTGENTPPPILTTFNIINL